MEITKEQIIKIMPYAKGRVDKFIVYLNRFAPEFQINTPLRWAHYLAQIAVESGCFRYTEEIASGAAYEGRKDLGNTQKGDGVRFKGRGLIQLTGRANYNCYKGYCGFDVVSKPELLAQPLGAVRSSMWYWQTHNLNAFADRDDVTTITKKINGGLNGFAQRKNYLARAKQVLGI